MNESLLDQQKDELEFDENKNWLDELVGENKKFKSPEELAKGKAHSDAYIALTLRQKDELIAENKRLREENVTGSKLQDLITKLEQSRLPSENTPAEGVPNVKPPTPEELDSFFDRKIQEKELRDRQSSNFNQVKNKLQEVYKDRYPDVLRKQLTEMGVSPESFDSLARNNPTVAIRALGLDKQQETETFAAPPTTRERFMPTSQPKRTWTWYQEQFKKKPELYNDARFNTQMNNDYMRLGNEFEDGDFKRFAPTYALR